MSTDPSWEERTVLELPQVESDEVRSCHEDQGQQRRVWFSYGSTGTPSSHGDIAWRRRYGVVSMETVLERMLLKDLGEKREEAVEDGGFTAAVMWTSAGFWTHLDQFGEGLIDEDEGDEKGEDLLSEARNKTNQDASLQGHSDDDD